MRRFLLPVVVVVLAFAVSGCGARADTGRMAAVQEIAAGDKLLAAKDYDGAYDRYVKAANECTAYPLYDQASSKATTALTQKVAPQPLVQQLSAFQQFADALPYHVLPLPAHIWLTDSLRNDAEAVVAHAKGVSADNNRALGTTAVPKTPPVKKPALPKPAAKKPAAKAGAKPSIVTSATKLPTTTPVAATAAAAEGTSVTASATVTPPPFAMPSVADFATISQALPGLGQPASMQQLYASLAEIAAAAEASEHARSRVSPRRPLTLAQRRTLTAADARLTRALKSVNSLLASL